MLDKFVLRLEESMSTEMASTSAIRDVSTVYRLSQSVEHFAEDAHIVGLHCIQPALCNFDIAAFFRRNSGAARPTDATAAHERP